MNVAWYFIFFLTSGFCSLVYETVWLRLAMAKFGVTTPMVSIVLSIFMAGLALGSWGGGALMRRFKASAPSTPLRLYGLAELSIGASGLLVPILIELGYALLIRSGAHLGWGSSLYYVATGGWMTLAMLPWCTCMGATFPLAMAAIRKTSAAASPRSFSYLYLSNVLGAILGALVPTFFLIEMFGFRGTLRVASALNGILALTVFALSGRRFASSEAASTLEAPSTSERPVYLPGGSAPWLLFITGVCSMALEVFWIRQFTTYLGNVVYSFAVILALYLGATYLGSQLYRFEARSHDRRDIFFAWIASGFLALLPLLFADPILPIPIRGAWPAFRALMGVAPFSGVLGFLTPMLVDRYSQGDPDRAGRAYSINVLGSILGPLIAGFWLLPWLGEHWGNVALALPLFGVGLITAFAPVSQYAASETVTRNKTVFAAAVFFSIPLVAFTMGYQRILGPRIELRDYTATSIATGEGMNKRLLVNGIGMTFLTPITKYMAHLPLAFLPRPPQNGLVICFGMGTTFRSMASWGIKSTAVELVPSVPQLFGYFHPDGPELLKSSLAKIDVDDGRRFLERSTEEFDVITLDPPPPVSAPTTSLLFSREFYAAVKNHLRPGGILQVWVFTYLSKWDQAFPAAVTKALQASFPYVRGFEALDGLGLHLLASDEPIPQRDAVTLASRLPAKAAADFVEWGPRPTAEGMFNEVLQKEVVMGSVAGMNARVPPIQDDQPINEYYFMRVFGYYR